MQQPSTLEPPGPGSFFVLSIPMHAMLNYADTGDMGFLTSVFQHIRDSFNDEIPSHLLDPSTHEIKTIGMPKPLLTLLKKTTPGCEGLPFLIDEYGIIHPSQPQKVDCTICLETVEANETVNKLPCGHMFHIPCIHTWLTSHSQCPTCRGVAYNVNEIEESSMASHPQVIKFLKEMKELSEARVLFEQRRQARIDEDNRHDTDDMDDDENLESDPEDDGDQDDDIEEYDEEEDDMSSATSSSESRIDFQTLPTEQAQPTRSLWAETLVVSSCLLDYFKSQLA